MGKTQRCARATEAEADALRLIANKALGYPRRGVQVGRGIHVDSPESWDGTGPRPPGWTVDAVKVWSASAADSVIAIEDDMAAELQRPEARLKLSAGERSQLDAALAARQDVDLEAGGYAPKATAAATDTGMSLGAKLAIGAAAAVAAYEIANQLGLFN